MSGPPIPTDKNDPFVKSGIPMEWRKQKNDKNPSRWHLWVKRDSEWKETCICKFWGIN